MKIRILTDLHLRSSSNFFSKNLLHCIVHYVMNPLYLTDITTLKYEQHNKNDEELQLDTRIGNEGEGSSTIPEDISVTNKEK